VRREFTRAEASSVGVAAAAMGAAA
jgi:hypothetical protein